VLYKKMVITFRSVYSYLKLLPAERLVRDLRKHKMSKVCPAVPCVRLHDSRCSSCGTASRRGRKAPASPTVALFRAPSRDLSLLLFSRWRRVTLRAVDASEFRFSPLETPFGRLNLSVVFRHDCNFKVRSVRGGDVACED
jgi:hypothetical protein